MWLKALTAYLYYSRQVIVIGYNFIAALTVHISPLLHVECQTCKLFHCD